MVITPWGDSDSLRARRLRPVRGASAAEVVANQRERLFAAMVACVDAKGYAATTVADLVAVSGVSSRSFYDLFGDKARCLAETIGAILGLDEGGLAGEAWEGDPEQVLRDRYRALSEAIEHQPAAAKVCLTDAFAAGEIALAPVRAAVAECERRIARLYGASAERSGMPREMIAARLGGVLEVVRGRLRAGREGELSGLGEDIVALLAADRPPPQALRLGRRMGKSAPESLIAPGHAERAIRAFAVLVAEQGYAETTVDEVVRRASMSARTFYANFSGKEDLMMAAIDSACAQALAAVMPAFSRQGDWPEAVRAGFGALLDFLASRPALGRLVTVEVYAAGEEAIARRAAGLRPLRTLLEVNTAEWEHMAPVVYEVLAGGVQHLLYETVRKSAPEALPGLAPICTYLTLAPFIGAEAACAVANGEAPDPGEAARGRWTMATAPGAVPFHTTVRPTVLKALTFLEQGPATPRRIAAAVGEEIAVVREYMADLAAAGAAEEEGEEDGEPLYSSPWEIHKMKTVSSQQMATMGADEREDLTGYVWETIVTDVEWARESGSFDERLERYLTRTPMVLDEAGWRELTDLHARTLHEGFEIQARARRRLEESGEEGVPVRSVQLAFEVPGQDGPNGQGDGAG